ncbi:MAG: FAD-binding oxidoreductase [Chloroflexi bacterium]|nr:FAD-binding oxidoreductase [Chloroflexota bacterium]
MSGKEKTFTPAWFEGETPQRSYRSLFKWGDPRGFKHPNHGLYRLMKQVFQLSDADFAQHKDLGLQEVDFDFPIHMRPELVQELERIVGPENLKTDTYTRIRASYGKGMLDALRLRDKIVENLADVVLAPRSKQEIQAILAFCLRERIPLYIFGGGSTVTRGMEAVKGGVSIDLSVHYNNVIAFNEVDQTITVEAGMSGPRLEKILNEAPKRFNAQRGYTCGHFPQSFEYSSVGGWVVTRGAGQNSTYYGKIEDMVVSQEYITPRGILKTPNYAREATGPDFDQVMMGSEGTFGILTEVTLRVFRHMPENTRRYSYMFKNWDDAVSAVREIMQSETGYPSVFRLSDPEETDVAMRLYGVEGTPADTLLKAFGYKPMQKCLLLGTVDGSAEYTSTLQKKIHAVCKRFGAFTLTPFHVTQAWEKSRFRDPYLREDLQDYGILIDTLECSVTWSQLQQVHQKVREVVKQRPNTICMTHISHMYPQGANLYFIFIARIEEINEYLNLQYAILEAIQQNGAAMSHHHGVGKQTSPWLEEQIGTPCMDVIRCLKNHFDPDYILNPGGTLGLDLSEEQKAKRWGMR